MSKADKDVLNRLADLDDDACFQGSTRVKFEPRNNS
jgi:hypothetical protein